MSNNADIGHYGQTLNSFQEKVTMQNNNKQDDILQIDLDQIVRNKSGKRKIPGFVVKVLKRIVHQDEINAFLRRHHDKKGLDWSQAFLDEFDIKIKTHGEKNIPEKGKFIFAANHPMGGTESHVFMVMVGRYFKNIKVPVNDLLMYLKPMESIFIPLNKFGGQNRESIELLNDTFASNAQILIFPAGLASRKIKGEIKDLEWKKTFITKAIQYKRDVIPVYIEGRNSNFFYYLAKLRKLLHIKFNVEMMFLPNEVFKQKGETICLHFGKPISYETFDHTKTHKKWAKFVRDKVYSMRE
ncbi:MAG: 1-acyl-sn-glycerol-3-phosphate acyltransferase [Bacteroidota bacterium]|nr:1-acyl-sn-glycerol-3-phosphate acyltransferase [Bacteroidota bacterium]